MITLFCLQYLLVLFVRDIFCSVLAAMVKVERKRLQKCFQIFKALK